MAQSQPQPTQPACSSAGRLAVALAMVSLSVAAGPVPVRADAQDARSRLAAMSARERALGGQLARFDSLMSRLGGDIAVLQRRESLLQSGLDRQRRVLDRTQRALRVERARLARLRAHLLLSRQVLGRRLTEMYRAGRPDVITVVLTSRGFVDLLERGEFMRRINEQDAVLIHTVQQARDAVQVSTNRLAVLEERQRRLAQAILVQRDQVAATRSGLDRRRAGVASARADVRAALRATASQRSRLQSRLSSLEGRFADAGALGAAGGWAIPWSIVRCESGGRNTGPNSAGASGYYQIIPSTWRGAGGKGPAAYMAPKSEQDRVAAQLYNGGRGASNWVCAGL